MLLNKFLAYRNDIKRTWDTIRTLMNKNKSKRSMQTKFCVNGRIIEGDLRIANEFNKFFLNIGPSMASKITPINPNILLESFLTENTTYNFSFSLVSSRDIHKIIRQLKSKPSAGFDGINSIFLKISMIKLHFHYPK